MEQLVVITQCELSSRSNDPYYHPFYRGEVVEVISRKSEDQSDRFILCTNGKESSYLSPYDVEDIRTHLEKKMLERSLDFKADLTHDLEEGEDTLIEQRDIDTVSWLIEQAKRADTYKKCLEQIVRENGSGLSAQLLAELSLHEADQRFSRKVKEETQ